MTNWKGKSRGNVLGYKIFMWSLTWLGLDFAYFLLRFVAAYFVFASGKAFGASYYFFHVRLGQNVVRAVISIFRNYYLFGQVLIDKTVVLSGMKHKIRFILEGKEHLFSMQNGGILISGHLGSWEVGGKALDFLDKKINLVVFDAEHQAISQYMDGIMTDRNVSLIKIGDGLSHMIEIKEALARKEIIALHGDRFIDGGQTIRLDFLGETASFPVGPWHIASYFNVPVSYVFSIKESRYQYRFFASPLKTIPSLKNPMKRAELVTGSIREYVSGLEQMTRKYPHQWYNFYPFWK